MPGSGERNPLIETLARERQVSAFSEDIQSGELQLRPVILLVEDDQTLALLEADVLTNQGYDVVIVASGELAISSLESTIPDLVVLDLELTGTIQGWDVLQTLREQATTLIPVLLTTSSTTAVRTYIRNRGESKQTLDHLPKPYPMQTFLKRIKRMLFIAPQP